MTGRPHVRVDPAMRFGRPHVCGISVEALTEAVQATNGDVNEVADDYGLRRADVLVACWHAGLYGNRRERRTWGAWAETAGQVMWNTQTCDYQAISDPPTGGSL